jgi:ATP-dependent Clp protease ATP-binding subunit ClpC
MPNLEKKEKEEDKLQFLICSACNGLGEINGNVCPQCHDLGVVAWFNNSLLYWSKKIDTRAIYHDRLESAFNKFINIILVIFGIIGLAALGWYIWNLDFSSALSRSILASQIFWSKLSFFIEIFWFSVLTNMFLIYRVERKRGLRAKLAHQTYETKEMGVKLFPPANWIEAEKMDKKLKINVAKAFSPEAIESIKKAYRLSTRFKNLEVASAHLFASLFAFSKINIIFARLGTDSKALVERIGWLLADLPVSEGEIYISTELKKYFFRAYKEAYEGKNDQVDVTELLLTLAKDNEKISETLLDLDVDLNKIKNVIQWVRVREIMRGKMQRFRGSAKLKPKGAMDRAMTAMATPHLDQFSNDLTLLARSGYLAPCIGREKEIEEIFRIIEGGRGSAILVGNPGVGKTSIVEGMAERMVEEDVPMILQDKRLVSLSISRLISGVSASEAQERLLIILDEIVRAGNVILFIDNLQEIVGITSGGEESMDLSDVLAQALAKKYFFCLTTAAPADYAKYIENNPLGNVLHKVDVREVDENAAIQIIEAKSGNIEYRNNVYFSYDAVAAIVKLSSRYIHERYLPEKAISILEEVAVYARKQRGEGAVVMADDVANIISEKTGINLTKVTEKESEKLLHLEETIHNRVIGQEEAVIAVASSLRRARAELRENKRPIANLLFLGPTGVGKTELAKTVADVYFGNENNMIRLDMSEYQDKASIYRLIGAPGEAGILTEAVRKNPFTLLLLDEMEKAHPDILNVFLQVMDDGRLTDSLGRTIDFTNIILIATSNAGTQFIQEQVKLGTPGEEIKQKLMETELKSYFRPEFLNRFDGIIVFKPLNLEQVIQITKLMLQGVVKRLEEKGINFSASDQAVEELAKIGFDPIFGARPLRRAVQEKVDNALADYLLRGELKRRDIAVLEPGGVIRIEKAKEL